MRVISLGLSLHTIDHVLKTSYQIQENIYSLKKAKNQEKLSAKRKRKKKRIHAQRMSSSAMHQTHQQQKEFQHMLGAQMRRVSLPTALPVQQQQLNNGRSRSPRSRTPNSLSPKLGFLKEISEFDIDPPFISPAGSTSSSTSNSHCNSPMLLSPSHQRRPASARLYRRNRNSQPASAMLGGKSLISTRSMRDRQSVEALVSEEAAAAEEDDGFHWKDVDGFYGRKNSIPLQQLLANDLALMNGVNLKNNDVGAIVKNGEKQPTTAATKQSENHLIVNDGEEVNIPSDIVEGEDEEEEEEEEEQRLEDSFVGQRDNSKESSNVKTEVKNELKKPSSTHAPLSSPTKRRLMLISNRLYSLESSRKKDKFGQRDEEGEEEEDESPEGDELQMLNGDRNNNNKVKFMDSIDDELELQREANDTVVDEDVRLLGRAIKARKRREARLAAASQQRLRHFSVDSNGNCIVDSGVRTIRAAASRFLGGHGQTGKSNSSQKPRNPKARRSTCPEIWLSLADDEEHRQPVTQCAAVRLFGVGNVGKKCVAKQLASCAELTQSDDDISTESEEMQRPFRTVSFLLNEYQVHMSFIQGSLMPDENQKDICASSIGELTIFAVVYSVDSRESFIRAAQILYRLHGDREAATKQQNIDAKNGNVKGQKGAKQKAAMDRACLPLILIANKCDLQRKRRVSSIEGKMLAKIYKCPFVEISALLSANVDVLWREVLRKMFKYLQARERLLQQQSLDSEDNSSPKIHRQPLVGRIVERTRRFAKSCEDWIAARIVAI